jgi:glycosyltransferase involved in cell wall biosynthesis
VSKPRVVVLRGHSTTPWELRSWEALTDRFDITCGVTGHNLYELGDLRLKQVRIRALRDYLPHGRIGDIAVAAPGDRYFALERRLRGADIVHSAELGPWFSRQPAVLKRRLGFKLVLTVWETIPLRTTYRTLRAQSYRAETIPEVDLYLATTERARESLLLEDVPADRIEVAPPGIEVEAFAASAPAAERDLVVSPGRLVWEKGHQDVLRAIAALAKGLVGDAPLQRRLVVVGSGPEEARLKAYAADLGIAQLVEFRGAVGYEEMPQIFARASFVVLASLSTPTWEEQFGMVLAEAAAAGKAIIASASGAIPEVVGADATLVRAGDWLAIARALATRSHGTSSGRTVANGQAWPYSTEASADRLAAAYERVLAS